MSEISGEVERRVRALCETISGHLCDGRRGEILRAGVKLCIVGRPNVGKSSLLNILLQRPAAIVSPVPGTTRDIVSGTLDIGGYPVNILDSAGLRDGADIVEEEGIRRAVESAIDSDAAIVVIEASQLVSRLRECGGWENDCENKNGGLQVLEHDSGLQKTGLNTTLKERVSVNNIKLPLGPNMVNGNVDVNDEPKTAVKNEVPVNSLEFNNNSNTMGKQNCWPYSKKVRLVLLDILSELFKEKLSSMKWLEESNFLVLLNKIDLLNSHDRDFLSLCLSPVNDASENFTCLESESNIEQNHREIEVKPSLVSTFSHDLAPSSVGSTGDSSKNSIYGCKNTTGDGSNNRIGDSYNNNISDSNNKSSFGSGDNCNNAKLVLSSLLHNEGVNDLLWSLTRLCERLCWSGDAEREAPHITSARHRTHVADALKCLLTVLGEQESYEAMCGVSQTSNYCVASSSDGRRDNPVENGVSSPNGTIANQVEGVRCDGQTCVSWENGPGNFSSSTSDSFDMNGDWDSSDFPKHENNSCQPLQKFGKSVDSVDQLNLLAQESTLDVAAHYLFLAARHLGQITGHVSNEEVLDQIFSKFCIGK